MVSLAKYVEALIMEGRYQIILADVNSDDCISITITDNTYDRYIRVEFIRVQRCSPSGNFRGSCVARFKEGERHKSVYTLTFPNDDDTKTIWVKYGDSRDVPNIGFGFVNDLDGYIVEDGDNILRSLQSRARDRMIRQIESLAEEEDLKLKPVINRIMRGVNGESESDASAAASNPPEKDSIYSSWKLEDEDDNGATGFTPTIPSAPDLTLPSSPRSSGLRPSGSMSRNGSKDRLKRSQIRGADRVSRDPIASPIFESSESHQNPPK